MKQEKKKTLICRDFFPAGIQIDESRIFPMAVIATMSSGKSTLINALLGKDILPSSNAACTALRYSILDDDQDSKEIVCVTDSSGKTTVIEESLAEELIALNQDKNVSDVFIRSHVNGVLNTDKALLIIDTPGPNNSQDASHEDILYETISKMNGGLFLYVLNATQIGIYDDKQLLVSLRNILGKKPDIRILFALNKVDEIDEEYESLEEFMYTTKEYLEKLGFGGVDIVPVSARAAILFKKVLSGEKLTRMECREFDSLYELYEPKDFSMKKYVFTDDLNRQFDEIAMGNEKYRIGDLNQAIENTGIKVLEECIQKAQILSSERIENTVKVKVDYKRQDKMTKFFIAYNPYLVECEFKKNGNPLNLNSKIGAKAGQRLQVLLGKSVNWKGLPEEIACACDDDEVELTFRGRKIDYDDLKYTFDLYKGRVKFELKFEESKNDADIITELDTIFKEIKEKNFPEFCAKNEDGRDVFDAYEEVKNGIFEVSVIATMSSGKSTLINSLLHTELLPSENKAVCRILDNDSMEQFEAKCYASDEKTVVHLRTVVTSELLKEYNADEKVAYIDIEGNVPAISSKKIKLCLIDTPGPNNSRNENHGTLTNSIIRRTNAVVLYVMNATQMGIKDDKNLLQDISAEMKRNGKQSRDRFIFVINKCDELDEEKGETVEKLLDDVREYLKEFGSVDPILIPTSARLALLIRKDQNGEELCRMERKELFSVDDFVESDLLHFEKYATLTPTVREKLQNDAERFHENEETWDMEALIHTGVPAVEETICEYIDKYAYPMKIKDAIHDIISILDELDMKAKFETSIAVGTDRWEEVIADSSWCAKIRKQIEELLEMSE